MKRVNGKEMSLVSTAVIAAAGKGTRMWPTTSVIPKELLPLWNIPAILHLVLEFVEAGITNIIVVAAPHNRRLITELFDPSNCAPSQMTHDPLVRRLQDTLARCSISIIEQSNNYGNGTPLRLVMERYGLQPYVYAFGDDVVIGENATLGLIDIHTRTGNPVLGGQEVTPERKSSFGILECETRDGLDYVKRVLEKPTPSQTASNIASFGRYLVTPPVLKMLSAIGPGRDGEIWFIDAIIGYLRAGGDACTFRPSHGAWHTVGDPKGYADAVCAAARERLT